VKNLTINLINTQKYKFTGGAVVEQKSSDLKDEGSSLTYILFYVWQKNPKTPENSGVC